MLVKADDPFKRQLARQVGETLTKLRIHIEERIEGEISQFDTFSTDKVKKLLQTLALDQTNMTAIVFVQERSMAVALASLLSKVRI